MTRLLLFCCLIGCLFACKDQPKVNDTKKVIVDIQEQDSIFTNISLLVGHNLDSTKYKDSLAFLILPVQASCPACRDKTIDSIIGHKDHLRENHFIIISSNSGTKNVRSYFKERGSDIPVIANKLILDTTNKAFQFGLYDDRPTMYYTYNGKAYKKVASIPETVKKDLHHFFSR